MYTSLKTTDRVALLTVDRPEALNAMNTAVLSELAEVLDRIRDDDEVRVLVITGAGRAFVAGADIGHMSTLQPQEAKAWSLLGQAVVSRLEGLGRPVIAAVNGYALGGGCELALACDIRIASEKAVFGQPEVKLGMIAGFGGSQRLPRLIGPGLAKEMLFTGDYYDAEAALRMGLVNKVVPHEALLDSCMDMAKRIASMGPQAVGLTKEAVDCGQDMAMDKALRLESDLYALSFTTGEVEEGCGAFLEKRDPDF
jgi:enoyl-CoA hydratase